MKIYIYGYLIKEKNILIFLKAMFILPCLFILKWNSISAARSLLDIIVVDLLNIVKGGRFLVNYVFRNYNTENKITLKY